MLETVYAKRLFFYMELTLFGKWKKY